ncbi:CHRD domain-containing protein [Winogradskyella sp. A2]|uniref:CHRD domain-containing protein n=1 Tax=Winogradskyella sp. A2 TaxID=3366944 RepID=UPI00398C48D1
MKALRHYFTFMVTLFIATTLVSCSTDDDNNTEGPTGPNPTGNAKTYTLNQVANSTVSGTATFIEFDDNTVTVELDLQNTPAGGEHPAHIHFNTAAEGGGIAVSLTPVNGGTGESSTNFSTLDDGTAISFDQLLNFNGYINIHLSPTELTTIVAQGDIGQNELTGESVVYNLDEADVAGISGTAEFAKRANNTTLVRISLTGTPAGGSHPAHIHENDAATGGTVIVGLNPVDGDTGYSATQVTELVGGTAVTYDDLLTIDAYINVHLSDTDLATIVAQGNIGANDGVPNGGTTNFDVTNSGASAYIFNDGGFDNASNPNLTLQRGETYTFTVNAPGHPFFINSTQGTGTGNAYNDGVSNNGAVNGTITFTVPSNAPDTLFYNCEFHGSMTGTITIVD